MKKPSRIHMAFLQEPDPRVLAMKALARAKEIEQRRLPTLTTVRLDDRTLINGTPQQIMDFQKAYKQ